MSDGNARKRKNAADSENSSSVKMKKAKNTGRSLRSSSLCQTQEVRTCPYNLRSHAALCSTETTNSAGASSQASTSVTAECQVERCTICLSTFGRQLVGTPGSCAHNFCLQCLQKWAKESNTCPVGRQKFTHICVRKQLNGRVVRKVGVKSPRETMVGFHAPFTSVHELQISIRRRVDDRQAHNEVSEHLIRAPTLPSAVCPVCLQPRSI